MILIDDGYSRDKLDMPGVHHLEVSMKLKKQRQDDPPALPAPAALAAPLQASPAPAASLSAPAASLSAPAACLSAPSLSAPAAPPKALPAPADGSAQPADAPERYLRRVLSDSDSVTTVLKDLTDRTLNAVATKTWFNADPSEPGTVEFALRMFAKHAKKVATQRDESGGREFTPTEKDFPRFVTKHIFENDSYDALKHLVPHFCT